MSLQKINDYEVMNTYTYLIIYLSICALVVILIPAVKRQWGEFIKSKPQDFKKFEKKNYTPLRIWMIKILLSILLVVVVVIFFIITPLLLPLLIKYDIQNKKIDENRIKEEETKDNNLYFWKMNGVGNIQCSDCNYQEKIVSFIHGFNSSSTGLQCQSCGKFHALERIGRVEIDTSVLCECGGKLEREEPLFCPKCQSKNMKYRTHYMT